ncbi:MAG: hypothetical protein JRK53_01430 [Deltaproteobacteria bacterium]|nr:hypothetical protein [Deltaproteobacteria bacterium]MBW2285120.1 hypothetical protein [Deltaproteobacteria bacterium]
MEPTIVTGIMDIGRGRLEGNPWARPFSYYRTGLIKLMARPHPMIIYIQRRDENLVYSHRRHSPTEIVIVEPEHLASQFPYYDMLQGILHSETWLRQTPRMRSSLQYLLDEYLPLNMMKSYWLKEAAAKNPFNTTAHLWIDGGIYGNPRFPQLGGFSTTPVFDTPLFMLCCMPCIVRNEMHGFARNAMKRYAGVSRVYFRALGGILGGPSECVVQVVDLYDDMLHRTLKEGHLGTEENIFTILMHRFPDLFTAYHPVLKRIVLNQKWVARESRALGLLEALGVMRAYRRFAPILNNYDQT